MTLLVHPRLKAILGYLRAILGKLRVYSNWPWPNQQPREPRVVLCKTSAPTPSFDQCNKFERVQIVKPQLSHIHFLDRRPYHQNKVSCPDLIIDTQLTN